MASLFISLIFEAFLTGIDDMEKRHWKTPFFAVNLKGRCFLSSNKG